MLEISPLSLGYGGTSCARFAGLSLPQGGQCLLMGPSGSGKTTLLHTLAGLLTPLAGTVSFEGTVLSTLPEAARDRFRGRHIGMIFQTLHLMPSLNLIENLLLAPYAAGLASPKAQAEALLNTLGLWEKRHHLPGELSQGQKQRAAIARAVMNRPQLILADEPTSSLDDAACETVIALILGVARETGASLLISTHDRRLTPHFPLMIQLEAAS